MPMPRITGQSWLRMVCQCGAASVAAPNPTITISHTTIDWLLSVRASTRTVIADAAYANAASNTARPPSETRPSVLGRSTTSTPIKPTTTANQRRGPTCSCRIGTDIAVISNGATKLIEYAVDKGSVRKPITNPTIIPTPITPRSRCSDQRARSKLRRPTVVAAHVSTHGKEDNPRSAAICNGE